MSEMPTGTWRDYEPAVRKYLRYCKRASAELRLQGSRLDPKYHPTADGAVKMISHRADAGEAKKIREAFAINRSGSDDKEKNDDHR